MRVLSGIQPTGRLHWGNYFGAVRQYIDLQDAEEAYYFIANLHALTSVRDPAELRLATALDYVETGLCPAPTGAALPGMSKPGALTDVRMQIPKSPWQQNRIVSR